MAIPNGGLQLAEGLTSFGDPLGNLVIDSRSVKECRQDDGLVHLQFGVQVNTMAIPHGGLQLAEGLTSFGDPLGNLVIDSRVAEGFNVFELSTVNIDSGSIVFRVVGPNTHSHTHFHLSCGRILYHPPLPPGALSLSVRDHDPNRGDIVNHYKIKPYGDDGAVCITSKKGFPNLVALVRNYTEHADGLCCRLTNYCPRPPPVLSDLSKRTKDHWEIPRSQLVLQEKLGNGQFGEVWKGMYPLRFDCPLAVKTMRPGTMSKEEFLKEARIMKTLNHPRLVRLYAVVTTEPIFIVTELMSNGSLLHYLRSERVFLPILTFMEIICPTILFSPSQIADGMSYLEAKDLVHRDLAARNVLVGESNEVKVADFGLARQIDRDTEAYNAKQGAKFPIKWTAPEAALLGQFTVKSDVWSYGVVLYEIITYGQVPFPSMANTEILQQVSDGYRMPCPNNCPPVIYAVMLRTWEEDPNKRPSFSSLCGYFEDYFAGQEEEEEVVGRQHHQNSEEEGASHRHQFLIDHGRRSALAPHPPTVSFQPPAAVFCPMGLPRELSPLPHPGCRLSLVKHRILSDKNTCLQIQPRGTRFHELAPSTRYASRYRCLSLQPHSAPIQSTLRLRNTLS
ncbi:unnamed protein product [Schistocephalus solidus]|uniref:non-specific protein-tyrosine kinase n=1 Tax=Schistocephalus solidus TaxID=70667 RepID=A0A183SYC4_SCHSO|nr:unnamed protein product [Schistocephalus solidus]